MYKNNRKKLGYKTAFIQSQINLQANSIKDIVEWCQKKN